MQLRGLRKENIVISTAIVVKRHIVEGRFLLTQHHHRQGSDLDSATATLNLPAQNHGTVILLDGDVGLITLGNANRLAGSRNLHLVLLSNAAVNDQDGSVVEFLPSQDFSRRVLDVVVASCVVD